MFIPQRWLFALLRRLTVLSLLLCVGCSAQSNSQPGSPDVNQRIERQVRAYFNVPADVKVTIGAHTPSEFPNYDTVPVTLSRQAKSQTMEFLVSKDGKTLVRMKKIDVSGRPVRGNPDAKVTIINYDDFECPFCARMHSTLTSEILQQYGDKVKIVYKDYPLSMHPWAIHAANDANNF